MAIFERTLIITPHCDDETIGCGGLISKLAKTPSSNLKIVIVATHNNTFNYNVRRVVDNGERLTEMYNALVELGHLCPSNIITQLRGFEDGKLDVCDKKSLITQLDEQIKEFKPTAVLFPYSSHHQDHQAVYQASVAALRPTVDTNFIKLKAMYEYPYVNSWSSNLNPNSKFYIPLTKDEMSKKRRALEMYKSQLVRDERDILDISSIAMLAEVRGREIGHYYAEAFYPMSIVEGDEFGE